ncbi:hypothetical protein [Pseudomonas sp. DSV-1]|uniref:hypothetical protein n=1 Tax=Pseudomonas sp. DSV-1 TaxID=3112250 RepID=UPI002DB71F70|nr:hypothetical protein [Pseudomonas sp. DSV-1]MEC4240258.1 hypothetical protein [Pseudomonas sp. DSV-1]
MPLETRDGGLYGAGTHHPLQRAAPPLRHANNAVAMFLGSTQNVGTVSCWGCSLGKIKSDAILSPTRNQRAFVLNITVIGWVVAGSILLAWRVQQVLITRAL